MVNCTEKEVYSHPYRMPDDRPRSSGCVLGYVVGLVVLVLLVLCAIRVSCTLKYGRDQYVLSMKSSMKKSEPPAKTKSTARDMTTSATAADNDKAVKEAMDRTSECMILVYAPWCPHCSAAIPAFKQASEKMGAMPFYMINHDRVSPSLVSGDNPPVVSVTHFPMVVKRMKKDNGDVVLMVLEEACTSENIMKHAKKDSMAYLFY